MRKFYKTLTQIFNGPSNNSLGQALEKMLRHAKLIRFKILR